MQTEKVWTLDEVKADWARVKCEVAYVRTIVAAHRLIKILRTQEERKFNPYHDDAGRFTTADGVGSGSAGTSQAGKPKRSGEVQVALRDPKLTAALTLLGYLLGQPEPDTTPFVQFNAQAFLPGAEKENPAVRVGSLTREEVDVSCPRNGLVQKLTDTAAQQVQSEWGTLYPKEYGTRVHTALKNSVEVMGDPNFRAERSAIKSKDEGYGKMNSVRVDVIENVGDGTVCVYDIKTGKSGLSVPRMQEIANNVHSLYPGTRKLLIIEKRPR